MDHQVGRLRAELTALGVSSDVLIAFSSDNVRHGLLGEVDSEDDALEHPKATVTIIPARMPAGNP